MSILHYFHGNNIGSVDYSYKLHPVVVLSILDHYKRRPNNVTRVIGTLLGEKKGDVIYIKNSFPVPHQEDQQQVAVDMEYHRTMLNLYQRVHSRQVVVGWYSTGDNISYLSSLMHSVYRDEVKQYNTLQINEPIHLCVDVSLNKPNMPIHAFTAHNLNNKNNDELLSIFECANIELYSYEAEKIGIDSLINGEPESNELDAPATMLSDIDNLQHVLMKLLEAIETCSNYIESVKNNTIQDTYNIYDSILNVLNTIPNIDIYTFQSLFTNNIQDLLMLIYLANLTQTQINVAEKVAGLIV